MKEKLKKIELHTWDKKAIRKAKAKRIRKNKIRRRNFRTQKR